MIAQRSRAEKSNEEIIADGIVDVATELRLVDASELALMIRNDEEANIADVINSSTELHFKKGTLRYALVAGYNVGWESTPTILFDMEFQHRSVSAFFRLMLSRTRAGIEVLDVVFDETNLDRAAMAQRLEDAIADARVVDASSDM
jgi:hypothetical protein